MHVNFYQIGFAQKVIFIFIRVFNFMSNECLFINTYIYVNILTNMKSFLQMKAINYFVKETQPLQRYHEDNFTIRWSGAGWGVAREFHWIFMSDDGILCNNREQTKGMIKNIVIHAYILIIILSLCSCHGNLKVSIFFLKNLKLSTSDLMSMFYVIVGKE